MTRITSKTVLRQIGCQHLNLTAGEGYWYFIYDNPSANLFETHSIYTPRLSDMALDRWIEEGRDFVTKTEGAA